MNTQLLPPNLPSTASPIHHCCLFQNSNTNSNTSAKTILLKTQTQMQTTKLKTNTQLLPPKHPSKASTILNHCLYISQTHTTSPKTKSTNTNTKAIALCLNCLCLNLHLTQSNLYWSHDESIFLRFFVVWLCAAHSVIVRLWDCATHSVLVRLHTTLFSADWLRLYLYVSPPFCPH